MTACLPAAGSDSPLRRFDLLYIPTTHTTVDKLKGPTDPKAPVRKKRSLNLKRKKCAAPVSLAYVCENIKHQEGQHQSTCAYDELNMNPHTHSTTVAAFRASSRSASSTSTSRLPRLSPGLKASPHTARACRSACYSIYNDVSCHSDLTAYLYKQTTETAPGARGGLEHRAAPGREHDRGHTRRIFPAPHDAHRR